MYFFFRVYILALRGQPSGYWHSPIVSLSTLLRPIEIFFFTWLIPPLRYWRFHKMIWINRSKTDISACELVLRVLDDACGRATVVVARLSVISPPLRMNACLRCVFSVVFHSILGLLNKVKNVDRAPFTNTCLNRDLKSARASRRPPPRVWALIFPRGRSLRPLLAPPLPARLQLWTIDWRDCGDICWHRGNWV